MTKAELHIAGNIHTDGPTLERFSRDASSYKIAPRMVVEPAGEEDVAAVLEHARQAGESVTCRSGGSGLSGAGVGRGIILNFKALMNNRIRQVEGGVAVEPGVVLEDLLDEIAGHGLMLPAAPSSSVWCALGGNVGTRSTGPRTARYGTIDSFVSSLRFVTAAGDVVDTREKLPAYLENGLMRIRKEYLADEKSREIFGNRPFIAGGYNIPALSEYEDPRDMVTHLLVGSVGTLGIVTEIRLELLDYRPPQGTYAAFFRSVDELAAAVDDLKDSAPAAVEFVDSAAMSRVDGQFLNDEQKELAGVLLVEFDESPDQLEQGRKILESFDLSQLIPIPVGSEAETKLWEERRRILPSLWAYAKRNGSIVPSIIDDVAIHAGDLGPVYTDLGNLMADLGHEIYIFGHVGFGSLHARPLFELERGDLATQIGEVSTLAFHAVRKYGGTLVGEHNAGRSRSVYLEMELGESFHYLRDIKALFDPDDILNPHTVFDLAPITENMELTG